MDKHTRRPVGRITRIHDHIRRGNYPNCSTMAKDLEVTPKTIQRDVNFMRDEIGLPIAYHQQEHGFHYTRPVGDFPLLKVTAEDLVSLFVARASLDALENTPLAASLKASFKKLAGALGGKVSVSWSNLERAVSHKRPGALRKRDVALFEKVSRALLEGHEISFEYRKLTADEQEWETRVVRPYHLAEVDNGWYIVGHDATREACRTFALQRMRNVRARPSRRFAIPSDFDPEKHFGGSFGIWTHREEDAGQYEVEILFTDWAARFVPERQWHPSQDFYYRDPVARTGLVAVFRLGSLEEMVRWVLGWGEHAEVLQPPELREAVKSHLRGALEKYE